MQYVGLDVHQAFTYGVIEDDAGAVVLERQFKNEPEAMNKFLAIVKEDAKIALESCSCWQYVYDYLDDAGYEVTLAHPSGVRAIAASRKKTDRHDAKILADLMRMNMLPTAYAPPWDIRVQRQITRHRLSLTNLRTELKNKVHAIVRRHGIELNEKYSDAFTKTGLTYLKSLDVPMCDRFELDQYLGLIETINAQIDETQERIDELTLDDPAARLLTTIPGVGHYAALSIVAAIGDIRRFADHEKLTSYAGLNPSVHQSGTTCITGHISKQGSTQLRWILVQAANVAVRHDQTLGDFYERLAKTKGHNKAIVATARKMLKYIHTMLKNNIPYHALQIHKATKG